LSNNYRAPRTPEEIQLEVDRKNREFENERDRFCADIKKNLPLAKNIDLIQGDRIYEVEVADVPYTCEAHIGFTEHGVEVSHWNIQGPDTRVSLSLEDDERLITDAVCKRESNAPRVVKSWARAIAKLGQPITIGRQNSSSKFPPSDYHVVWNTNVGRINAILFPNTLVEEGYIPEHPTGEPLKVSYGHVYANIRFPEISEMELTVAVGLPEQAGSGETGESIRLTPAHVASYCPDSIVREVVGYLVDSIKASFEHAEKAERGCEKLINKQLSSAIQLLKILITQEPNTLVMHHIEGEYVDADDDRHYHQFTVDEYVLATTEETEHLHRPWFIYQRAVPKDFVESMSNTTAVDLYRAALKKIDSSIHPFRSGSYTFTPQIEWVVAPSDDLYSEKSRRDREPKEVVYTFTNSQKTQLQQALALLEAVEKKLFDFEQKTAEETAEERRRREEHISLERQEETNRMPENIRLSLLSEVEMYPYIIEFMQLLPPHIELTKALKNTPNAVILAFQKQLTSDHIVKAEEQNIRETLTYFWEIIGRKKVNEAVGLKNKIDGFIQSWNLAHTLLDESDYLKDCVAEKVISRDEVYARVKTSLPKWVAEGSDIHTCVEEILNGM